jgi:hypothetical protein
MIGAPAAFVRRHCDAQTPAPVLRETAQQQRDHCPLETKRCDIADIVREPPLAGPEQWHADEQYESTPRHP